MNSLEEVRQGILGAVPVPRVASVYRTDALGLVLSSAVIATENVPPFANTAMDGYAVRAADTVAATDDAPVRLRVVADLAAGYIAGVEVGVGEAIRIMTGASMPQGADAIVMVERTERDGANGVLIKARATTGDHIRAAGGDVVAGQEVFDVGTVLGPAHIGVLSSLGIEQVEVFERLRVGVLSTGDELREGAAALGPGQIRDSNRPMLLAMVEESGCEAIDLGITRDDEAQLTEIFESALASCDVLVTSGGVSVGDYDVVKAVLDQLGVLRWWQVAIKPAKPLAFGLLRGVPVFGLPGNPVSSHVSFELFARPALKQMMGHRECFRREVQAVTEGPMPRRSDGKTHFDRVCVRYDDGQFFAMRSGAQASNALAAMAIANGLAILPDGDGCAVGDPVRVMLLH